MEMYKFMIRGVVQGVGFRPFVYNACRGIGIRGSVQNVGEGVVVIVDDREKFEGAIGDVPDLARVDSCEFVGVVYGEYDGFEILDSDGEGFSEIPADLFLCKDCHRELNDVTDRRYGYFFVTCTNCGPRFSMVKNGPYDRSNTTMDEFVMCEACAKEYRDPGNRRYHAQTIACNDCGPKLVFFEDGKSVDGEDLVKLASDMIRAGEVVAIKGVGGFHLVCKAEEDAVGKLRKIGGRLDKPYAVMVKDINDAEKIVCVGDIEKELLISKERPIVVLKKKQKLDYVSELDSVGVMLPYTALHYLLFKYLDFPIVMTSSNMPDEPLTSEDEEQKVKYVLSHNRKIENRIDDSLVKVIEGRTFFLRRSRGYVPESISVESDFDGQILAVGAELNSVFSVYKNRKVISSQFMGNTRNYKSFENYKKTIRKFLEFSDVRPDVILCDLHPGYNSSGYARELSESLRIPLVEIQHHKAHTFSVVAENGLKNFVGIVCDGLGYGEDGTIWGGEIFNNGERVGHLEGHVQLGGDSATLKPSKMLFGILRNFLSFDDAKKYVSNCFNDKELFILDRQLREKFNCPKTTSCGRVLDAASTLLGFCDDASYEGRPAVVLEANSSEPFDIEPVIDGNVLNTTCLFEYLVENLDRDKGRLAATVQLYLAKGLFQIAKKFGKQIVFSGGCAYNEIMSSFMIRNDVLVNEKVPCGDGGISFGQIAYYLSGLADSRDYVS